MEKEGLYSWFYTLYASGPGFKLRSWSLLYDLGITMPFSSCLAGSYLAGPGESAWGCWWLLERLKEKAGLLLMTISLLLLLSGGCVTTWDSLKTHWLQCGTLVSARSNTLASSSPLTQYRFPTDRRLLPYHMRTSRKLSLFLPHFSPLPPYFHWPIIGFNRLQLRQIVVAGPRRGRSLFID